MKTVSAIVIDDDTSTVDVFTEYLNMIDVAVIGIGYDGKSAVELYAEHKPDMVFLDLMMPSMMDFMH